MYIGSTTASKNMDHIMLTNSISELDTDGLSFFTATHEGHLVRQQHVRDHRTPHRLQASSGT